MSFRDEVAKIMSGKHDGYPCCFDKRFAYRAGEVTVYAGQNGHGKSMVMTQLALDFMCHRQPVMMMSFEMHPARTIARMLKQAHGARKLSDEDLDANLEWINGRMRIYSQQGMSTQEHVLGCAMYAAKELMCRHIIVDNLMTCVKGEDDYTGQKEFIGKLSAIAKECRCHIHLVHHVRKQQDETTEISKFSLRGSASISDLADNIVLIQRNLVKEKSFEDGDRSSHPDEIEADTIMRIAKQRNGDWEGSIKLWFNSYTKSYCKDYNRIAPSLICGITPETPMNRRMY